MPFKKGNKICIGRTPWNKGIARNEEVKQRIRKKLIGRFTKENNHNWKGGISSLENLVRTNFKYRQWRSDIFTRDDFTCQICGNKEDKLNTHHIKSFNSIIQKYEVTTLERALNCEELWNINNGITLCEECHKEMRRR